MEGNTQTRSQRKNIKKREKAKKKKRGEIDSGIQSEPQNNHEEHKTAVLATNEDDGETVDNFEEELCWCIEQLQLGLQNQKPVKGEAERAQKLIRILKSDKTHKAKKRQIMHSTFGNYRKKMVQDAKSSAECTVTPSVNCVDEEKQKEGVFFRTCTAKKNFNVPAPSDERPASSVFMFNFSPP